MYNTEAASTVISANEKFIVAEWVDSRAKRAMDIVAVSAILLALSPLIILIAVINKFMYPRYNIFYKQVRLGKHEREFRLLKFRTMVDGYNGNQPQKLENYTNVFQKTKIEKCKKITRFGAVLRKFYLDELPQLFNVLKGDMSLIGPRPALKHEIDYLRKSHPDFKKLLGIKYSVKPGVTGPWQVDELKFDLSDREVIQRDIDYVEHSSLSSDLKLSLMTVLRVFGGTGQ